MDPTFPPMEFVKKEGDKDPVGVDVGVATALAQLWSVKLSTITMDFNGLLPSLGAARCDAVISGATLTEERQKAYDGIPYLNTFVVVIAKAGAPEVSSFDDLAGKTIAVQSGTTYVGRMEKENERLKSRGLAPMTIQQYPKQTDAIQQLLIGRVAGVVTQDTEVAYRELLDPGRFATIYTVPQEEFSPYAIYIRKNGEDKANFTAAVASLYASGAMRKIVDDWKLSPKQLEGVGYKL
jgi:polar amino acid transport system substrate-binding protein